MSSRKGQRAAARVVREQMARERRRQRTLWTSVIAVAALVIAGLVGWGIYASQKNGDYTAPQGATSDGTGIIVGSGPVTIDVYEDFICPACGQFEKQIGGTLDQLVSEGKAKVIYRPVAFLDRFSTTEYSTRSSAASGCAAEGGKFREYAKALFDRQPPEGGPGLSNDELISIGTGVGLDQDSFGSCVRDGKYKSWTRHVTEGAAKANVNATPTVLVDGKEVQSSAEAITAAVAAAGK
ncbi:thioredoxin domain-containing protein [Micromonospora sonneratiae]|uniref:DsbA family protein n=1 Tax=Micromonospora sonneratiae TaxID=1184706 RepID=A0ABW3YAM9_9ACTN